MIRKFEKFLERRGLELNTRKSNILKFIKSGRKGTDPEFKWKGKKIEIVKDATYFGYKIQSNNADTKHIEYLAGKANAVLGRIWILGERKFREDWERRMRLLDALVRSVISYKAKIWGLKEWKEIEKMQNKYIKWTLKLDKTIPSHIIHEETNRWKIAIQTAKRAMKFEQKVVQTEEDTLTKKSIRLVMATANGRTEMGERRRKFYEDKGSSDTEVSRRIINGETVWPEMVEKGKDEERQKRIAEIRVVQIRKKDRPSDNRQGVPSYLKIAERKKKKQLETQARFRLESENRSATKIQGKKWEELVNGERRNLANLMETTWKRRRTEIERQENSTEQSRERQQEEHCRTSLRCDRWR